jgi:superfamily II DNA helicase RecQ
MYREIEFRTEFSHISEIRSLVPNTKFMALTATASSSTKKAILSSLGMTTCYQVISPPNKTNIKYFVYKQESIEGMIEPIVHNIGLKGIDADRTIIFCKTYTDTLNVFKTLVCTLGKYNLLYCTRTSSDSRIERVRCRVCEKYDGPC